MDTSDIAQIIRERAAANGVDPETLLRIAQVESNLNPNAAAQGSSAKGLFQFTDPTARQYGLTNPYDPAANADAAARLTHDNASRLGTADPGSLYLAHFAGLGGTQKLMGADPSAPAGSVLGDAAVRANPFLANMTVGQVRDWASGKMGGQAVPQGQLPQPTPQAAPTQAGAAPQPSAAPQPGGDDPTDAALATLKQMFAQQVQSLPPQQLNILQAAARPRRMVTLNG